MKISHRMQTIQDSNSPSISGRSKFLYLFSDLEYQAFFSDQMTSFKMAYEISQTFHYKNETFHLVADGGTIFLLPCHVDDVVKSLRMIWRSGGRFINEYELLNLTQEELLKFQCCIKIISYNVWVRYFEWNFKGYLWNSTQNILPIHWKLWMLFTGENLRALRFKSS